MTNHNIGLHWLKYHEDRRDLEHVERMQYRSAKVFQWMYNNKDWCGNFLAVLPKDSLIVARDHPRSEQKEDMYRDPVGTGLRHANEVAEQVRQGEIHLPLDRTFFTGINEPNDHRREQTNLYEDARLRRLAQHGLRGAAFSFSTGHPLTIDGTGSTNPDYAYFEKARQAIVSGNHIAIQHIYGAFEQPLIPGHYDRLRYCPWDDVTWIIGECGIDQHALHGGEHIGYLGPYKDNPTHYCQWMDAFMIGASLPIIHSWQFFTFDFSHPWGSFDLRRIREALERYPWQHAKGKVAQPPGIGTAPTPAILPAPPMTPTAVVNVPAGANLRAGPGTNYNIRGAVAAGTPLSVVGKSVHGAWWQVDSQMGRLWVADTVVALHNVDNVPVVEHEPPPASEPQPVQPPQGDKWQRSLAFCLRWEGGWADHPNDPGGATMKGITIGTYTRWRASQGQPAPTKTDLARITDAEVARIYHDWYWIASGADKLPWPNCLAVFDLAVNGGVGRAKQFVSEVGVSFIPFMARRLDWYTRLDGWKHFGAAWTRRCSDLMREASK